MTIKRKDGEVFVTALDPREMTEIRRCSRPSFTKEERQRALVAFLAKQDFEVRDGEPVYVWC